MTVGREYVPSTIASQNGNCTSPLRQPNWVKLSESQVSRESIRVKAEILWERKPRKEKGKRSQRETTVKKGMGE